jgi:hypothetical protein
MNTCFICLDSSDSHNFDKLCATCVDSTLCKSCHSELENNNRAFILMNCPMCRKPTKLSKETALSPRWHICLAFFWYMIDYNVPPWLQLTMLMTSYKYMENVCRKLNLERENNNPLQLKKRWRVWTNTTFIPYVIATYLMPFSLNSTTNMNIFMFGHLGFPILSTMVLYMVKVFVFVVCRWFAI